MTETNQPLAQWRGKIKVHPAAELFPLLEGVELDALVDDIRQHGVKVSLIFYRDPSSGDLNLLDGRNRLNAIELAFDRIEWVGDELVAVEEHADYSKFAEAQFSDYRRVTLPIEIVDGDPHEIVTSLNVHRRHLTSAQKRELIARLLRTNPERSDNATAKIAKVSDKTVAAVRHEQEARSEIPNVTERTDSKGRQQPATKQPKSEPPTRFSSGKSAPKPPEAQARDKEICETASKLAQLTGPKLAQTIEDQVRLISDVKWSTISDARRTEIARLVRKMLERIEPENGGLRAEAPMAAEVTDQRAAT